ncbi:probable DNA polymerase [Xenopus laevis]|uniref:DNA-directed DNA polymerase n=1 Tax=Xenopus laevis TaxID=8355 RepID=A0A8J1MHW2_XENLA|nr:probable DNA polymerase [Xenopus laevis]
MQPYNPKQMTDKYIFYDFECMQETGVHVPNYIFATTLYGPNSWEFNGKTCTQDFVRFFTNGKFLGYTFIAHNAGRYDAYFVVQELIKEKFKIEVVNQGGRLMCVSLKDLKMRFIDSLNFMPMKLSKMPEAMGFSGSKGHFPHFFNTEENQNYIGPMPDIRYYGVDYMMPGEKKEFVEWYQNHKNDTFHFQAELKAYCKQDVEVLRRACECYRDTMMDMTKKNSQTIL